MKHMFSHARRVLLGMLVLLIVLCFSCAALAETNVTFTKGKQVEVFNENGVHVYLTGEVEDSGMMWLAMNAVVENKSSNTISVSYEGICNGWSVNKSVMGGSASSVRKGAKGKSYIWLLYDDLELKRFSDVTELTLDFIISDTDTNTELFRVTDVNFTFPSHTGSSDPSGSSSPAAEDLNYYEDCPILPCVESYGGVYQSGSSRSSSNGKVNKIVYRYKLQGNSGSLKQVFDDYVSELKKLGFTVSVSGSNATISSGSTKLGTLSNTGSQLEMNLVPGNEKLTKKPSASTVAASGDTSSAFTASGDKKASLGDTLKLKNGSTFKVEKAGTADKLYSYANKSTNGRYFFYEPTKSGNTFLYAYGTFTNKGSTPVDIRHVYAAFTVDGKYTYDASVIGVVDGGSDFYNDVSPMETVGVYVYAEVPKSVAKVSGTKLRLGFTEDFGFRFVKDGLPDFTRCYDTYEIPLTKTSSGAAVVAQTKPTGKPAAVVAATKPAATPEPEPVATGLELRSTIIFGAYEQDGDKKNGKEPLEWIVLDIQDGKALLLTSKIIDYPQNSMNAKITWQNCKLRTWLNKDFLNAAFNNNEKKAILTTNVHTDDNPYYLRGKCDTKDKVFFLSMNEALEYFEHRGQIGDQFINFTDPLIIPEVTEVARKKAIDRGDITAFDKHLSWWLRDTGDEYCMTCIYIDNYFDDGEGMLSFNGCWYEGVRPAIWVEIDKLPQ